MLGVLRRGRPDRRRGVLARALLLSLALAPGASPPAAAAPRELVVTSLGDEAWPPRGTVTLRSALRRLAPGGRITFSPALGGGTIRLRQVGSPRTLLPGEVFEQGRFAGYRERDYGRSALFADKDLVIDAAGLPGGITLAWAGGEANPARVLAVRGDLTMRNVTVRSGHAAAEPTGDAAQPYTLARGGGIAVWGTARLARCTIAANRATGDEGASRDRGAFGGGVYANVALLGDCVVSGNAVTGYGAAGGGVYSVGGAGMDAGGSVLARCAVTGNRVTGQHAYGGGVYSDGGGPGNDRTIVLRSCTIARNAVGDHPGLEEPPGAQYYYRGGGFYMSNGSLDAAGCTIAENEVTGVPAVFGGKPNMGGGGIAATIGNAHVVERMDLRHSIVAGNTVGGVPDDVFTGSLLHFFSGGHNLLGTVDFDFMLVPAPAWWSLSRRHWPKAGDRGGVAAAAVLDLGRVRRHRRERSVGTDAGARAVLWYPPRGVAVDRIPPRPAAVLHVVATFTGPAGTEGGLLDAVVGKLRADHGDLLGGDFGAGFGNLAGVTFTPVADLWPAEPANQAWVLFWRQLDAEIAGRLGPAGLDDRFWGTAFPAPGVPGLEVAGLLRSPRLVRRDQRGRLRPAGGRGDVGAVER